MNRGRWPEIIGIMAAVPTRKKEMGVTASVLETMSIVHSSWVDHTWLSLLSGDRLPSPTLHVTLSIVSTPRELNMNCWKAGLIVAWVDAECWVCLAKTLHPSELAKSISWTRVKSLVWVPKGWVIHNRNGLVYTKGYHPCSFLIHASLAICRRKLLTEELWQK